MIQPLARILGKKMLQGGFGDFIYDNYDVACRSDESAQQYPVVEEAEARFSLVILGFPPFLLSEKLKYCTCDFVFHARSCEKLRYCTCNCSIAVTTDFGYQNCHCHIGRELAHLARFKNPSGGEPGLSSGINM